MNAFICISMKKKTKKMKKEEKHTRDKEKEDKQEANNSELRHLLIISIFLRTYEKLILIDLLY